MSKIKENKIKPKDEKRKLWKFKIPKPTLKISIIIGIILLLIFSLVLGIKGYNQCKQLSKLKEDLTKIGKEVQLGYHRESKLIERLELIDVSEFQKNCDNFSFNCVNIGSKARETFLKKLKTESFNDEEIEVLNMISSIDISVKEDIKEFNKLLMEYNKIVNTFPINVLNFLLEDIKSLYN